MTGTALVLMNRLISNSKPFVRYQMPVFGRTFKAIDQFADAQKMYADYARNVGRSIKYASFRDPRYTTSSISDSALGGISQISGAGKTVRKLI